MYRLFVCLRSPWFECDRIKSLPLWGDAEVYTEKKAREPAIYEAMENVFAIQKNLIGMAGLSYTGPPA